MGLLILFFLGLCCTGLVARALMRTLKIPALWLSLYTEGLVEIQVRRPVRRTFQKSRRQAAPVIHAIRWSNITEARMRISGRYDTAQWRARDETRVERQEPTLKNSMMTGITVLC